ncbi:molybdopterin-dependent oxidoreductase [Microbacterium lacus]|uniref:molybdopterin-dependent oxidoreductase n=1 Tax=Microbacterium lacus TaxID=415217 RepID=UPI00384CEB4F
MAHPVDRTAPAFGWAAGVGAVIFGAGLGELTAAVIAPSSSPVAAIGAALIDAAPSWAKDAAIALFGTADKIALIAGIALVGLVLAAFAGWLELRRPRWGAAVVAAFGVVGAVVAMLRPDAGGMAWLPSIVAGGVGALTLWFLVRRLRPAADASTSAAPAIQSDRAADDEPLSPDRRRFFAWTGAAAVAGVLAIAAGSVRSSGAAAVTAVRRALRLPTPAGAAAPIPASAELRIPGLARVITPNDSFYRIDTALIIPEIDPADWSLRVHGMVENEFTLTWDELLALPLEESVTTLACVSNPVGGELIGNALWLGYPIRELLARAKPVSDADMVLSTSRDGFTASTPIEALTDDRNAILAVGMNGEPLPLQHGFPVRMVVPGLYGYVSATKWVTSLEVTRFDQVKAYWSTRGWSERGPIKLQSRIDVPRRAQGLKAGETVIAGVAWHQHVGVSGVEVQIDEGEWRPATLATAISEDTWVQWSVPWVATEGDHLIRCRAISADGEVQTSDTAGVAPDGATGWHERFLTVFA